MHGLRSLNDDDDGPDEAEVVAVENEDSTVQRRNITDLQADGMDLFAPTRCIRVRV